MKYKVGDIVRVIRNNDEEQFNKYIGEIAEINVIDSDEDVWLTMSDGKEFYWTQSEIELYDFQRQEMLDIENIL